MLPGPVAPLSPSRLCACECRAEFCPPSARVLPSPSREPPHPGSPCKPGTTHSNTCALLSPATFCPWGLTPGVHTKWAPNSAFRWSIHQVPWRLGSCPAGEWAPDACCFSSLSQNPILVPELMPLIVWLFLQMASPLVGGGEGERSISHIMCDKCHESTTFTTRAKKFLSSA